MFHRDRVTHFIRSYRFKLVAMLALVLLLTIFWLFYLAPQLKAIPTNFTYTADTLSLDNLFDSELKKYQGQYISKTNFGYKVLAKNPLYLTIENYFNVSTLSNRPIASFVRHYYINPKTGQHVAPIGKRQRAGYLFAPRYVGTKPFTYWHVNYDAPAQMHFIKREKIAGLTVSRYQALYTADQTKNLTYLPLVPSQRGVITKVNLQLWIEPVSGWLVKYQDNSIAYFYDRKTGAILSPWNNFSNVYTQTSVRQQVHTATILKWKILFIDFVIPLILFTLSTWLFWLILRQREVNFYQPILFFKNHAHTMINIVGVAAILFVIVSLIQVLLVRKAPQQYLVGIAPWNMGPDSLQAIRGFKKGLAEHGFIEGKNIKYLVRNADSDINKQINIIQYFLDKNVAAIFTLTTPGTLVAKSITNTTPIIFTNVVYPVESNLIKSVKNSGNNLVGVRSYIPPAVQFNTFEKIYPKVKVIGFVHHRGDPDSDLQYIEFKKVLDKRDIKLINIAAIDVTDLTQQLQTLKFDTLYLACDSFSQHVGNSIVARFSEERKIPTFSCDIGGVQAGLLIGNTPDNYSDAKLAGRKVSLILIGADPAWLDTETPRQSLVVANATTAHLLGLIIPMPIVNVIIRTK